MTLSGLFIGIDRHQSLDIRELSGARRDATALWALFADSLPAADLRLLVDEGASVDTIRRHIRILLGEAGPDDAVVLTFSGHGSQDHRIVAYDTIWRALARRHSEWMSSLNCSGHPGQAPSYAS